MTQFRLTNKFARDLKIIQLELPKKTVHPLDDWIVDVFRLDRKKVAITTQVQTLIAFVFPYSEVGGAKNVLEFLSVELEEYLRDLEFEKWVASTLALFNEPPIFTKTENRKVLGHMNDFKRAVQYTCSHSAEEINWHDVSDSLGEILVNIGKSYATPKVLITSRLS